VQPGDVISERYRLLRLLDVGGMGEVWAAKNELTQKSFAIKFLLPAVAERPDCVERFIREAETAGSLDHPAIVDVFDVAQAEDGRPYIVMELLAGESLEARLERSGPLSSLEAASFLAQIADGLDMAHRAGIVHRDLSLANVFLARNPEGGRALPKILDFGVSKTMGPAAADRTQTGHGAVLGCPEFMSPEQARGAETVDARTDVWSLGVVMYQSLTGAAPFKAKNYNALMISILTRAHRPLVEVAPSVDPELAALVEACLAKDRGSRVQTAREVADRLGAIARRLAGPDGLDAAPRRRATDRLPQQGDVASRGVASDEEPSPSRLRLSRGALGAVCATLGVAVGVLLATLLLGASPTASVAPDAAIVTPSLGVARGAARGAPETTVPAAAPRPLTHAEPARDVGVVVARGAKATGRR
jgi:eukaryotic-like serine/threonine-protein kinase